MEFKNISPKEINESAIRLIGYDWMLVTAGTMNDFNCMTAAWGGLGYLWNKPVAFIFVRPQRYTYQFTEKHENFTLTFFDEKYRHILNLCGTKSGRQINKMKDSGLTPVEFPDGNIFYSESRLAMNCRKIYFDDLKPENFIDSSIQKNYPLKDYHRIYIGEITNCLIKSNL